MKTECLKQYIADLNQQFKTGLAREHSYRPALKVLLQSLLPKMVVTNEPAHFECGAPDYIISREKDHLPVFFVEAKDVNDADLDGRNKNGHKEQFDRYKQALDHIIFTDYLDFHLYEYGEFIDSVRVAEIKGNNIVGIDGAEEKFAGMIEHLATSAIQSITSASRLAKLMAAKARLLANIIDTAMNDEAETYENDNLQGQYNAFKDVLIQELTKSEFADIYAQTIVYGMFAARLHDETPEDFSREEAAKLIPKTNPFLRQIFNNLAGNDLDERIAWVVDDLVTVFRATNLQKIMDTYSTDKRHHDPMIHFYEDFLSEYDARLRKAKGVWYTPQPVVGFIVRAVDEILKTEFGLPEGLADYSMVEREVVAEQSRDRRTADGMKHMKQRFHRVQILDPATGTGTFLAEVVNQIYDRYRSQQGIWQQYVEQHLLPRLNGFEILMASYAVAHLKLDMLLTETGYQHKSDKRLHVYLTNSLEESTRNPHTLFAQWLSREASEANVIKRDYPVMVMIGNPPYSVSSNNKGEWISGLLDDYKKNLNERNIQPLSDDYIKFIRLAQHYVERNGEGIVAYISNNSFIDGLIHRQMRSELMRAFDKIYILDLHGNSRKKETAPDGSKDENVFDIMQGVSINIFVKKAAKGKTNCQICHYDLYGERERKYQFLQENTLQTIQWQQLNPKAPQFYFVPKDFSLQEEYEKGFKIDDLMKIGSTGIETRRDNITIQFTEKDILQVLDDFKSLDNNSLSEKYGAKDSRDWKIALAKEDLIKNAHSLCKISYRPFDDRYTLYTSKTRGFMGYPFDKVMRHLVKGNTTECSNIALCTCKRQTSFDFQHILVSNLITERCYVSLQTGEVTNVFPLYLYPEDGTFDTERRVNLDESIWVRINTAIGGEATPEQIFDYIYGVLHSPRYRERFREFLKVDFPRIPYPANAKEFERYAAFGTRLRQLHLMHNLPAPQVTFPESGTLAVEKAEYRQGRVYINATQYFDGVPESAWNFYIGGYQPAQKWLKDRKTRTLSFEDVRHYQQIIYVLQETEKIMSEIDEE